jgi:RimJ/RimL family protein N-acetyltransferase
MQLISENSALKNAPLCETVWEEMWQSRINENTITYSILSPKTQEFMGYCQYKNLSTTKPDIGIELLPKFRKQGLGYAVCSALIRVFFEKTAFSEIYYKVERKNTASIALVEKLSGKRDGVNHVHEQLLSVLNTMSAEEIAKYARSASALITALEKYGEELSKMEYPTDILIYRIDREAWTDK